MTDGISIIVPIYGRIDCCQELLYSFSVITSPEIPIELLLADNSDDPVIANRLKKLSSLFHVTYLHTNRGVVCARNEAAAYARYRYLLFVDSDCTFDNETLTAYACLIREQNPACAAGKTIFIGEESVWWRGIKDMVYFYPFRWCEWDTEVPWSPSCNLLICADVFREIGGFHSILGSKEASEDVDICIRIRKHGYAILSCPKAIVYHTTQTWNNPYAISSRFFRFGKGQAELILKHKDYINALPSLTNMFWVLAMFALLFSCLRQWIAMIAIVLLIIMNPLLFLCIQYIRLYKKTSLWSLVMHLYIEYLYDSGKLFHSIRKKHFFFFKNYVYSDEMVMGLWKKNVDEYISYIISITVLIFLLCCLLQYQ